MVLQTRWVRQELIQEYVGRCKLDRAVSNARVLMKMLPKSTPIVPPPRSVRHESKVELGPRPVADWMKRISVTVTTARGKAGCNVQLDHDCLLPV